MEHYACYQFGMWPRVKLQTTNFSSYFDRSGNEEVDGGASFSIQSSGSEDHGIHLQVVAYIQRGRGFLWHVTTRGGSDGDDFPGDW